MRKHWLLWVFLFLIPLLLPARLYGQFIGFTSPQTVQRSVFTAVNAPAVFTGIPNLGQSVHYLVFSSTQVSSAFRIRLEGTTDGVTWTPISEDGTQVGVADQQAAVFAVATMPGIRANLVSYTGAGTLSAFYIGTSVPAASPTGFLAQASGFRKVIAVHADANGAISTLLISPVETSGGTIYIRYFVGSLAGSTLAVNAGPDPLSLQVVQAATTIANSGAVQTFPIDTKHGRYVQVIYTPGAFVAGVLIDIFYEFTTAGKSVFNTITGDQTNNARVTVGAGDTTVLTVPGGATWLVSLRNVSVVEFANFTKTIYYAIGAAATSGNSKPLIAGEEVQMLIAGPRVIHAIGDAANNALHVFAVPIS